MKRGDKVKIIGNHPHTGETGVVSMVMTNGVMVKRDTDEIRNICPVQFNKIVLISK